MQFNTEFLICCLCFSSVDLLRLETMHSQLALTSQVTEMQIPNVILVKMVFLPWFLPGCTPPSTSPANQMFMLDLGHRWLRLG